MEIQKSQRQTAYKTTIKELNSGKYTKQEGWNPNYVLTPNGKKISRTQIIGVVVSKAENENATHKSVIIDDNTGNITIRSFDEKITFENIEIGDVIITIGRPREYENSIYLVAESINKNINPKWAEVWKKEIETKEINNETKIETKIDNINGNTTSTQTPISSDVKEETIGVENEDDDKMLIKYIKEKDTGKGVEIQQIIEQSGINNSEEKINKLLRKGELFEIQKGIVKVLE